MSTMPEPIGNTKYQPRLENIHDRFPTGTRVTAYPGPVHPEARDRTPTSEPIAEGVVDESGLTLYMAFTAMVGTKPPTRAVLYAVVNGAHRFVDWSPKAGRVEPQHSAGWAALVHARRQAMPGSGAVAGGGMVAKPHLCTWEGQVAERLKLLAPGSDPE